MSCGMCESHINDTIRREFKVKSVKSSYKTGITEVISEAPLDTAWLKKSVKDTGYSVLEISSEPYEKKGFFGLF